MKIVSNGCVEWSVCFDAKRRQKYKVLFFGWKN